MKEQPTIKAAGATSAARPDDEIDGAIGAHRRLLDHVADLTDDVARGASRLPGWSVGHVLAHLARNADSFTHLLAEATAGVVGRQYPGGMEQRNGDIDAGSGRSAAALVADLRDATARLERAWDTTAPEVWASGRIIGPNSQAAPLTQIAFRRWRETEVHHADLGLDGFGIDDWSSGYVQRDLAQMQLAWRAKQPTGAPDLPPAVNALTPARRLAWLLGRLTIDGHEPADVF